MAANKSRKDSRSLRERIEESAEPQVLAALIAVLDSWKRDLRDSDPKARAEAREQLLKFCALGRVGTMAAGTFDELPMDELFHQAVAESKPGEEIVLVRRARRVRSD